MKSDLRGLTIVDYRHRVMHAPGLLGWANVAAAPPPPPPPLSVPSVSMTAPTAGGTSTVVPVTVTATATANSPATSISQVEFFADGSSIGVDSTSPFSVSWSPDNGTYTLQAEATDNLGGTALSTTLSHTVSVSPPAGTTLTTLAISNESSSASVPANFVTQMFGHTFKKADVPTGDWPQLQLTDGTAVAANVMQPSRWPDGSMRFASLLARIPVGITAKMRTFTSSGSTITLANQTDLTNGDACLLGSTGRLPTGLDPTKIYYVRLGATNTATFHPTAADATANTNAVTTSGAGTGTHRLEPAVVINVKNGGSAPAAASVSSSTITSNSDLKVSAEALLGSNWSGANVSSLNTGISDGGSEVAVWGSGPVGIVLRVYQEFNNGSADNAQAGAFHYVQCLQNSVGGLYGLRYLPSVVNGWHDVASATYPIDALACDSIVAQDGSTTIADPGTGWTAKVFTWSSGSTFAVSPAFQNTIISTGESDWPAIFPVKLTTTGALPSGLSASTTYWARQLGASFGQSSFTLHTSFADASNNASAVSATTSGSGTHSLNVKPWIWWHAAGLAITGSNAEYTFVTGATGTGAESTTRVTQNLRYMLGSRVMPPWKLTSTTFAEVPVAASRTYALAKMDTLPYGSMSGAAGTIGIMSDYQVSDMMLNNARTTNRVAALQHSHRSWATRRDSTKNIVNLLNDSRPGFGASVPTFCIRPTNPAANSGANNPTGWSAPFQFFSWDHRPSTNFWPFVKSGEPQFLDAMHIDANSGIANQAGSGISTARKQTVNGVDYYCTLQPDVYEREEAWRMRDIAQCAMVSSSSWNGADFGGYFSDIIRNEFDYETAYHAHVSSAFANSVYAPPVPSDAKIYSVWQGGFWLKAKCVAYVATEDADCLTSLNRTLNWFNAIRVQWGLYYLDTYFWQLSRKTQNIASWDEIVPTGSFGGLSWDGTTDTITCDPPAGFGPVANGAVFASTHLRLNSLSALGVSGLAEGTPYYVRDWNSGAKTFKLATTAALSDVVDITATATMADPAGAGGARSGGDNTQFGSSVPKGIAGYGTAATYDVRFALACGATIPSGYRTALDTAYGATDPSFTQYPQYAMFQDSYIYT